MGTGDEDVAYSTGREDDDTRLEITIGQLALRPPSQGIESVKALLEIIESLDGIVPGLGAVVKSLAATGAWAWNKRKVDRVRDTLVGLYQRLERTRSEYVRKDEFQDILEETLRRLSEQPNPERRRMMRTIFERILEEPLEHRSNRLFLRLADELPSGAVRLLSILRDPVGPSTRNRLAIEALADQSGIPAEEVRAYVDELVAIQLMSSKVGRMGAQQGKPLDHLLTKRGEAFVRYFQEAKRA
jgi:hypothetical protein